MNLNRIKNSINTRVRRNSYLSRYLIVFSTVFCGLLVSMSTLATRMPSDYEDLPTEHKIHKDYIKTVQLKAYEAYPSYPVLRLGGGEVMNISFDDLSDYDDDYLFKAIHCSHDWVPSDLESHEYLQGFHELPIREIETSFNSAISYTNYSFDFPNDMMTPTLSGNYLIVIYPEDDFSDPIITARVVVYEELISYKVNVKESSIIKERTSDQEVDFDLLFNGYSVSRPYEDIHNVILQNFDWNTCISDLPPQFVKNNEMNYDYGEENNFNGNNEYRFVGLSNLSGTGPRIASISINASTLIPEVQLRADQPRSFKLYTTLRDINGDYKINSILGFDDRVEAEYCEVYFYLEKDTPLPSNAGVHVLGNFNLGNANSETRMTYNYSKKRYELKVLLKQGYYNYLYAVKENGTLDYSYLEGSHAQTENDYHIITYDSNANLGYDRVIGFIKTNTFR